MNVIVIQPFKYDGEIHKPAAAGAEPNVVEVSPKAGKALIESGSAAELVESKTAADSKPAKGKDDKKGDK